jgi:glyoxylase-like metal-dependent hydrolase (beta-lactamase superfamily II)
MSPTEIHPDGMHVIDLQFQGMSGVIAAYLLQDGDERILIEVGPESTLPVLLAWLEEHDIAPESINALVVTHIHLDHAGAAGAWIERFPRTRLLVHEVGAPHMIDPSKLLVSATRIYGDQMGPLWGRVIPVPAANVTALTDGDVVTVGRRKLTAIYTPGHASHHLIYHDPETGAGFTGDVAAIRQQGFDYVRAATPPPDISLEHWRESLDRIEALQPQTLYLTHFGGFNDASAHLAQTRHRLEDWAGVVQRAMQSGTDPNEIKRLLLAHADREMGADADPSSVRRYELATPTGMSADGLIRYFTKQAQRAAGNSPA